jgi:transcriptional regulator with XRE-family HTH domain
VFYDKYAQLCKKKGISMSAAALEAGLSKSLVTKWKANKVDVPSPDVLKKLSNYFGMPVSELLGEEQNEEKKEQPTEFDGLSKKKKSFIDKVMQMSDAELDKLDKILALVENTN